MEAGRLRCCTWVGWAAEETAAEVGAVMGGAGCGTKRSRKQHSERNRCHHPQSHGLLRGGTWVGWAAEVKAGMGGAVRM